MSRNGKPRFFLLLNRAQRELKTRVERETRGALGLTSLELVALWALTSDPELGVQKLARVLHVDHAVVSRLSKQLVR
ncbi:MAG: MarR family transcriptional regulator, partial [Myxococcota bacterium]